MGDAERKQATKRWPLYALRFSVCITGSVEVGDN